MIMKIIKKTPNNSGFTLFEIIIVITIMSVLSGIAYVGFSNAIAKRNLANGVKDLQSAFENSRTMARTEKKIYGVLIDFTKNKFILFEDKNKSYTYTNTDRIVRESTMPAKVELYRGLCGSYYGQGYNYKLMTLIFYPNGTTNGSTENWVKIRGKNDIATVYLDRYTGRVKTTL